MKQLIAYHRGKLIGSLKTKRTTPLPSNFLPPRIFLSTELKSFLSDQDIVEIKKEILPHIDPGTTMHLGYMSPEEYRSIPRQLLTSPRPLTETEKEELIWFLGSNWAKFPDVIPCKDTLYLVASVLPDVVEFERINDVLCFGLWAIHAVDKRNRHSSLTRRTRRDLLRRIQNFYQEENPDIIREAKENYRGWVILAESVHPLDYVKLYPKAKKFFDELLGNTKAYRTWNSILQQLYDSGDMDELLTHLSQRPRELILRFDSLLGRAKTEEEEDMVVGKFLELSGDKEDLNKLLDHYNRKSKHTSSEPEKEKIEFIQDLILRKINNSTPG